MIFQSKISIKILDTKSENEKNRHQTIPSDAGLNFAPFCLVSYVNGTKNGFTILHLHSRKV